MACRLCDVFGRSGRAGVLHQVDSGDTVGFVLVGLTGRDDLVVAGLQIPPEFGSAFVDRELHDFPPTDEFVAMTGW